MAALGRELETGPRRVGDVLGQSYAQQRAAGLETADALVVGAEESGLFHLRGAEHGVAGLPAHPHVLGANGQQDGLTGASLAGRRHPTEGGVDLADPVRRRLATVPSNMLLSPMKPAAKAVRGSR